MQAVLKLVLELNLGLTAGQIARRTHTAVKRVKVTTSVARSELAAAVLARYGIPLDRVAVIAEFDGAPHWGSRRSRP